MALKITFITFIFLASFVHNNDSILLNPIFFAIHTRSNVQNHLLARNNHYICPKSPKTLYEGTPLTVDPAITDSANNDPTEKPSYVKFPRLFIPRLYKKERPKRTKTSLYDRITIQRGLCFREKTEEHHFASEFSISNSDWHCNLA